MQITLDFESDTLDKTRLRQLFVDIILDFEREKEAKEAAASQNAGAGQTGGAAQGGV